MFYTIIISFDGFYITTNYLLLKIQPLLCCRVNKKINSMSEEVKQNISNIIANCDTVQFCSFGLSKYPETRIVANMLNRDKKKLQDLTLYFFTNRNSHKIAQIKNNNNVCLYYFDPITRHAITLFGYTEIILDQTKKEKFWMDDWVNFGYKGKEDTDYCVIKFTPQEYKYYVSATDERTGTI